MQLPSVHPFRETIHRVGDSVGVRVLQCGALDSLVREVSGPPGVIAVRGCREGAGVSFLVEASLERSAVVPVFVEGVVGMGWSGLRQAAGRFGCAEKLVPALLGRFLASLVRGGLLPSTDPEMVAIQLEHESSRVLDFGAGTPMTRWLLERESTVGPALARRLHSLALPDADAFLSSLLTWVKARSQGEQPGWMPPGHSDKDRVRSLAMAASACGMPLVWVFDGLDSLVFDESAGPSFWRKVAVLAGAGSRVIVAANEHLWKRYLEPCLPAAWMDRMIGRSVRLDILPPMAIRQLLSDRLAAASARMDGLPEWVVSTALPMGGTPREALVEAALFWDLQQIQPVAPVFASRRDSAAIGDHDASHGSTKLPSSEPPWVEGLLAAAAPLPFIEAAPLLWPDFPQSVILRSPGLWVVVCACDEPRSVQKIEDAAARLRATAPLGTVVLVTRIALTEKETVQLPVTWNLVRLTEDEKFALAELAVGRALWGEDAAGILNRMMERLTRPPAFGR